MAKQQNKNEEKTFKETQKIEKIKDDAEHYFLWFDGSIHSCNNKKTKHTKLMQVIQIMIKHDVKIDDDSYNRFIREYVGTKSFSFFIACENFAGDTLLEQLFILKTPKTLQLNKLMSCMNSMSLNNLFFGWIKKLNKLSPKQKEHLEQLGYIGEHVVLLENENNTTVEPLIALLKKITLRHLNVEHIRLLINKYVNRNDLHNNINLIDVVIELIKKGYFHSLYIVHKFIGFNKNNNYFIDRILENNFFSFETLLANYYEHFTIEHVKTLVKTEKINIDALTRVTKKLTELNASRDDYTYVINHLNLFVTIYCPKDNDDNKITNDKIFILKNGNTLLNENINSSCLLVMCDLMTLYSDAIKKKILFSSETFLHAVKSENYMLCSLCMNDNVKPTEECLYESIRNNNHISVFNYCVNKGIHLTTEHLELSCEINAWHITQEILNAKIIPNQNCGLYCIFGHNKKMTIKKIKTLNEYGMNIDKTITSELILLNCYSDELNINGDIVFNMCHDLNINMFELQNKSSLVDKKTYSIIQNASQFSNVIDYVNENNIKLNKYYYDLILEKFILNGHRLNKYVFKYIMNAIRHKQYMITIESINRIEDNIKRHRVFNLFRDAIE
jgi:hypothetical protein